MKLLPTLRFQYLSIFTLILVLGISSCGECPGERPVVTFVNDGYCNCDIEITSNDTRYLLGGHTIEVTLFPGTYYLKANCKSGAYLNGDMTILEQIGCDLNANWSTTVVLGCGDEYTYSVN